jgi:para-aminobenzoate synthetase component II
VQHGQRKRIINMCKNPNSALFNMPTQFESGLYHSWAVEQHSLPEVLSITCMSEDGIVMGICHKQLPIEGFQFHPESFLSTTGHTLLNNWLNL